MRSTPIRSFVADKLKKPEPSPEVDLVSNVMTVVATVERGVAYCSPTGRNVVRVHDIPMCYQASNGTINAPSGTSINIYGQSQQQTLLYPSQLYVNGTQNRWRFVATHMSRISRYNRGVYKPEVVFGVPNAPESIPLTMVQNEYDAQSLDVFVTDPADAGGAPFDSSPGPLTNAVKAPAFRHNATPMTPHLWLGVNEAQEGVYLANSSSSNINLDTNDFTMFYGLLLEFNTATDAQTLDRAFADTDLYTYFSANGVAASVRNLEVRL